MASRNKARVVRYAVGVTRISVDRPDQTSTETQRTAIEDYCRLRGYELVKVIEERGRSAYKGSPKLVGPNQALQMVQAGAADAVVCWRIDRVARRTKDLLDFLTELERAGGSFASTQELFDTSTPSGKAIVTIIAALAEMESAVKAERTQAWHDHRRLNGATPTGRNPFGYRRVRNGLAIIPDQAELIRNGAMATLKGASLYEVASYFNAMQDERTFTRKGIRRILMNPTTAGLREGDEGRFLPSDSWEPILDRATWDALQEWFADPRRHVTTGPKRRWLLTGIMECGECGTGMSITSNGNGPRYACEKCKRSIRASDTEELIEDVVLNALNIRAWRRLQNMGVRSVDVQRLEQQIVELASRKYDDDWVPGEFEATRAALKERLADATAEGVALPNVDDPRQAWPDLDVEQRRMIVAAVVPKIVIGPVPAKGSPVLVRNEAGQLVRGFDRRRIQWEVAAAVAPSR
jgi:site-specific DNA recombinase